MVAQALQGSGGLEQRLVVVVQHVRVGLWGGPLRDLGKQLKKERFQTNTKCEDMYKYKM